MGIKTGRPALANSLLLNGFLPLTTGTCLLVSMTPCFAHGGDNPMRGLRHQQRAERLNRFSQGAGLRQVQNGFVQAFNDRVQRNTTGVDSRRFDLDLSSTMRNIELGSKMFNGANGVTINAGGAQQTFNAGDQVTAAQYVAIQQVLSESPQSISLNEHGTASGGSFSLNQAAASRVNNLLIPQSVAAVNNFATNRSVNLSGDLTNLGSIYGMSTSSRVRSGVISADDINNSGSISTDLSGSFLQSTHGTVKSVDLTLVADHNLNNSGSITSSGALTVATAYGAVSNSGTASAQRGDLHIFAGNGNLENSGTLNALNGNLNIDASQVASDLNINGAGGSFNALRGDINIRDLAYTDSNDTTMNGGTFSSKNLNVYAGGGTVNASVDEITGTLNTAGAAAHILASGGTLTLGSNCLTGDPTFVNTTGDILITGGVTAGESIAILAAGDIIASGNAFISTQNSTGAAAVPNTNITLVAGATVATTGAGSTTLPGSTGIGTGQTATVNFNAGLGGNVDFSKSKFLGPLINTSSNLPGGGGNNQQSDGGDVFIAAFSNGVDNGFVLFPAAKQSINTTSYNTNSGSVTIIAGGVGGTKSKPVITTGIITTQADPQSGGAAGAVKIFAAQPETDTANATPITFNSSGDITGGVAFETDVADLAFTSGNIQITGSILAGAADITLQTTGTGGIFQTSSKVPLRVQGGAVALTAGLGGIGTSKARISTQANQLNLTSAFDVFVNNLGSVTLNGGAFNKGTAGNLRFFDITTTPDGQGNGRITIANNSTIEAQTGLLNTINLTSSEVNGGTGGIRDGNNTTNLIATNINLKDGANGLGLGDIGQGNPIETTATFLSANTAGSVELENSGPVTLLDSSAGNGQDFILGTIPLANNGTITLGGDIKSAFGRIGNISIDSSESGAGIGGIIADGGTLVADSIDLSDTDGGGFNGDGSAAIGTPLAPITVQTPALTVNTLGPSVNVTNTITTGMTLGQSQSGMTAGNSFQITSSSGILVSGAVDTGSTLTLIAGKTSGYLIVGNNLNTNVSGGTIALTAPAGITRRGNADITADNIILTSTAGGAGTDLRPLFINSFNNAVFSLTVNCIGFVSIADDTDVNSQLNLLGTTSKNQFNIFNDGNINVNAPILTPTGIKLSTLTSGQITLNQSLGSTKSTNVVELDCLGTGAIVSASGTIIGAKQLVNLSTNSGNIGSNAVPLTVSTPGLSANTNSGTASVDINALATKSVPLTLFNSGAAGDFDLTAAGSVLLNNIQTIDGSITVKTTAGTLSTNINSRIQIAELANKATGAKTINLQNAATKSSKGAAIFIGAGSTIATFVNTPGTGPNGGGAINIWTTSATDPTQTISALPTNVVLGVQTGGTTFFGANGITALAPNNTMDNVGADITFDTGTKAASAIVLGGGVLIHADPPVTAPSAILPLAGGPLPTVVPNGSAPPTVPTSLDSGSAQVQNVLSPVAGSLISTDNQSFNNALETNNGLVPLVNNDLSSSSGSLTNFATLAAELSNAQTSINFCSAQKDGWISETELANGEIPAQIFGDVTVSGDHTAGAELEYPTTGSTPSAVPQIANGQPLVGAVTATVGPKVATLHRGTVVVAPSTDTVINTPVGQIKVGAKSLAMVMAFADGLAVYDLDDARKGAVEVVAGGQSITMSPGQHIFLTRSNAQGFDEVNPAQMIGYRGITSRDLNNGLKVFSAEFSVPHACHAVKPLKHLLQSKHPQDRKVAEHLLKTTAVTMQLRGRNGEFQQVFRPRKTAWAQ